MLFSDVTIGTNDIEKSKIFYDSIFQVIGAKGTHDNKNRLVYIKDNQIFMVTKPIDGNKATYANGGTIGFNLNSIEQVNLWHQAGVNHGGKSVEDPPGIREFDGVKRYLAYLRDPDGNKLCGYFFVG